MKFKLFTRSSLLRLGIIALIILSLLVFGWSLMIWMPGVSYNASLPPLSTAEIKLAASLKQDVERLGSQIGRCNWENYQNLLAAQKFLTSELEQAGYTVNQQSYRDIRRSC